MWQVDIENVASGTKYRLLAGSDSLPFRDLFHLLASDDGFADWYTDLLSRCDYQAFYWEHPPLTVEDMDHAAEFVLIEARLLASLSPDPAPFRSRFDERIGEDVIMFPNLGGDATLIVPRPVGPPEAYPHLAAFVHRAPESQVRRLWRRTAETVLNEITTAPRWLSTAGLGVAWLHVRLDTQPKYYSYAPYKDSRFFDR